jgi:membrane-bound ClpP family serine protease
LVVGWARARRLLWFLTWFGVFFLIVGAIFIWSMGYLVHEALGVYGLTTQQGGWYGPNGIWFVYFDVFESSVRESLIASVIFGIIIGSLGMFGVIRRWNKKTDEETMEDRELQSVLS